MGTLIAVGLALISGLFDAFCRNVIKVSNVPPPLFTGLGFLCALPIYLVWLALTGIPVIDPRFWWVLMGCVPLFALAQILTVRAHRASSMVNTAPYIALTPALLLVTGPLMGTGQVSPAGGSGVLVIACGVYALNMRSRDTSWLSPFRNITREKGAQLMVYVAVIFSITSNFDYLGFTYANSPLYLLCYHGLSALLCLALARVHSRWQPDSYPTIRELSNQWYLLLLFGLGFGLSVIPHMLAFQFTSTVAYVVAGKQAGVIVFSIAIAFLLMVIPALKHRFKNEFADAQYALLGVGLMIVGMLLVILA